MIDTESGKASVAQPSLHLTHDEKTLALAFRTLRDAQDLALLLEVPLKTLSFYVYKKQNYREFYLKKRSGGTRLISTPDTPLKIIQRKLSQILYAAYGSREPVHGFAKGRSIRSNASRHLQAEWLLNFDLQDFFPSIHYGRVAGLFAGKAYNLPPAVASLIARICCHNSSLPAGAPTSPIVANMICGKMDAQLKALAWSTGCVYTRYADDLTFSTKMLALPAEIVTRDSAVKDWVLSTKVVGIIEQNTFKVNAYKTRVRSRHSSQEVTGVRINSSLNVKAELLQQVRAMLHAWEKFGKIAAEEVHRNKSVKQSKNKNAQFGQVLRGKIEFVGFIRGRDDAKYLRLLQRFTALAPESTSSPIRVRAKTAKVVIEQAIWLLEDKTHKTQGTAFAVAGGFLVTAAHCLDNIMFARRPHLENQEYLVNEVWRDDDRDVAVGAIEGKLPVELTLASPDVIVLGSPVCLVGFPNFHISDSVAFRLGSVVQKRSYAGREKSVQHYIVDADIVKGNSGGPVLDSMNRVIGVAIKGINIPGKLGDNDQLSSFVSVDSTLPLGSGH